MVEIGLFTLLGEHFWTSAWNFKNFNFLFRCYKKVSQYQPNPRFFTSTKIIVKNFGPSVIIFHIKKFKKSTFPLCPHITTEIFLTISYFQRKICSLLQELCGFFHHISKIVGSFCRQSQFKSMTSWTKLISYITYHFEFFRIIELK